MTVSTRVCCSMISLTHVPYAVTTRRSSDEDECVDAAGGLTRALAFVEKNFEIRGCFGLVAAVFCPGVAAVLPLYGGGSPRQGSLRRFASYLYTRRAAASLWSASIAQAQRAALEVVGVVSGLTTAAARCESR